MTSLCFTSHFEISITRFALASFVAVSAIAGSAHAQMPVTAVVAPEPGAPISAERTRAHALFRSLTGVSIPIDDPRLKQMESLLVARRDLDAAKVATADALFYDNRVRDLARSMSSVDETPRAPITDFVATFVGVVRDSDSTSGKELLTGNFTYRADPALTTVGGTQQVPMDELNDIIRSNNHYAAIQSRGFSLYSVLRRSNTQTIANGTTITAHPDPAGIITSRGFMAAHATAGTNRRLVEFAFRQFLCQPITAWADATAPDDRVSQDVSRTPAGSNATYLTTCKACHGQMDALRPAFARVDFNGTQVVYTPNNVPGKMTRNAQEFPAGFVVRDDSFVNYANVGKNADNFGWRSSPSGRGMAEFGAMIANSRGFSRCMSRRVFSAVCKRDPASSEESVIRQVADEFETSGYHMRGLFEKVALRPECGVNQ